MQDGGDNKYLKQQLSERPRRQKNNILEQNTVRMGADEHWFRIMSNDIFHNAEPSNSAARVGFMLYNAVYYEMVVQV